MGRNPHVVNATEYNRLASRALLRGIRLTESRFDMKPDALQIDPDSWRKDISGEVLETFADPVLNYLAGSFVFEVVCRHKRKRLLGATAR
jgi:hypothetical protein